MSHYKHINIPDPQSIPLPEETTTSVTTTIRDEFSGLKEENEMLAKMMGFSSFDSTKGKQVPGNNVGAVNVSKKRKYRQYMNRKGGFNRPLDKVA